MEDLRKRIAEDLADSLAGEIHTDAVTIALYSTDASLYEIEPVAVAFPQNSNDVATLARYCSENEIPLIPRGAGTGVAGGALGRGIVIDFSRHMNQVISVDDETVRVQPGVVLAELNRQLRPYGRYFPPDPSNSETTTIGGMVAVDAAGSHAVRVGSARDHIQSLQCVLMGGQVLEFGRQELIRRDFAIRQPATTVPISDRGLNRSFLPPVRNEALPLSSLTPATRQSDIVERLAAVLHECESLIAAHQPSMIRNCSGYMLRGVRRGQQLDFPRLLAGSEGTLAVFTEATLYTMPLPEVRGISILMFDSLDAAVKAMQELLLLEPGACDLLDRRLLSLGRESDPAFHSAIDPNAEAGLFVEFQGSSVSEVEARINDLTRLLNDCQITFRISRTAYDPEEVDLLWSLPARVVPLLASLRGASRPLPFVEDIAVPPPRISEFLTLAQKTFQRHEVTATLYSHAASGQIHLRPILPNPTASTAPKLQALARDLYRHVKNVGGTISGEHGDGLSRTAFIRSQYGPLYRAFQQIKDIFDPQRLLNPDKVISDDGQLTTRYLRNISVGRTETSASNDESLLPVLQLNWSDEQAMSEASHCNGCGTCRSLDDTLRMCPFFRYSASEDSAPRSKANLVRESLAHDSSAELLANERVQELAKNCFNCKQCQIECPSTVDIPHLILEARAQYVNAHGLSKTDWLLSRFHTYARFASRFTFTANRLLRHRIFRKLLSRTIGIAEQRRLPEFASKPFLKSSRVLSKHNTGRPESALPTVVYFVDYFANHHDPQLAEAFVRILLHNGFRVYIPPQQTVSGMAMIAVGDLEAAREAATTNLRELGEPAREGFPIICTEPAAALCLSQEYPLLTDHPDTQVVADQTTDAGAFLWQLHEKGKLKTDFTSLDLDLVYHTPCHVRSLNDQSGLLKLVQLIAGVNVTLVEKGCSGMAGTFGIAKDNFQQSIEIGRPLIDELKSAKAGAGMTECSSCRMQMEQEASIPTIHPIKILALAYGLMPELAGQLASRPQGRILS